MNKAQGTCIMNEQGACCQVIYSDTGLCTILRRSNEPGSFNCVRTSRFRAEINHAHANTATKLHEAGASRASKAGALAGDTLS
eukprot:m.961944 g.961944  ORF g.961944 m.961944 type:complete len:83 (-) comp23888_c0_seq1:46-294(-)